MYKRFAIVSLMLVFLSSCQNRAPHKGEVSGFHALSGPYFGQECPRETAQLFMPGIISTYGRDGTIAFLDDGEFCVFTTDETGTRFTYLQDGHWTMPEHVPWGYRQGINDYTLGGDGKTFYWQSARLTDENDTVKDVNLWKSERNGVEWTKPVPLPEIVNHPQFNEIYPTAAADGSVYHFCDERPDSHGADIYVNRVVDGKYSATERLPWPINSDYSEVDFIVATDESYLIFASDRPGGYGQCDNYISFRRDDGDWTHPVNMGNRVNSYGNEIRSFVAHDNTCFFFGSTREAAVPKGEKFEAELATKYGDFDVYYIDAAIISELRSEVFAKECAADLILEELEENGVQSAIVRLKELHSSGRERYRFSIFELLSICEDLIEAGKADDAERVYSALLDTFDAFRVKYGYATILSNHDDLERAISLLEGLESAGEEIDLEATLTFLYYDLKANDKIDEAIRVLQRKIERFPGSYHSYCYLAALYEGRGDIERAMAACDKAIEINPDSSDAREILERLKSPM